jgi:hypothetical protein
MATCLWTDHPSRIWGRVCIGFFPAGATSYTYQRMSYDIIDPSKTKLTAGFETMIGLEKVPQLELSLNVRSQSFSDLLNLLQSGPVLVRITREDPIVKGGKTITKKAVYDSYAAGGALWIGVVNAKLEVDLIKDDSTRLIVDEATHWAASECTGADFYNAVTAQPSAYRITNIDDVYEIHHDANYTIFMFDGKPIKEVRHWGPNGNYNYTRWEYTLRAIVDTIVNKLSSTFPFFSWYRNTVQLGNINFSLLLNGSFVNQTIDNVYVPTDYDASDPKRKYWGFSAYIQRCGSLRDALKEFAESILHRMAIRTFDNITGSSVNLYLLRYFESNVTASYHAAALVSRKLFANVISSCTVTADKWGHERIKEYTIRRDNRYNDFGARLALFNVVPFGKGYVREDNAYEWRFTPQDVDYEGLRNVYVLSGGRLIRAWLIAPYVDATQHVNQVISKHGLTINPTTSISPSDNTTYLLAGADEYSLRNVVARSVVALMGQPSAELRTYRMQDVDYKYHLGTNNGYGYMLGYNIELASGIAEYTHYRIGTTGYAD